MVKYTVRLMRIVGIPGLIRGIEEWNPDGKLMVLAELNKVQMLLHPENYANKYGNFLDFLEYVAMRMEGLEYTVVKTIRPFPRIPADVDLIIHRGDLHRVLGMFKNDGLVIMDKAPYGATLYSKRYGYYLDITTDLSVSGLIYLRGDFLINNSRNRALNGIIIRAPVEPLDLLAVIAHSVIKEWMFTLSDYYTAVLWLNHITEALKYAKKLHLVRAFTLFMSVVKELSDMAYGQNNPVSKVVDELALWRVSDLLSNELPVKYSPNMLIPCYVEKLMSKEALMSIPSTIVLMVSAKFMRMLVDHVVRVSY